MQIDKSKLALIGTAEYPLRPSALRWILLCPWRVALLHNQLFTDDSGPAADTGSATHAAIEEWHRTKDQAASIKSMRARLTEFPLADLSEAESMYREYIQDPRNINAEIVICETKVSFTLPPSKADKTKKEIVIQGTLDQVRRNNGRLELWDVKTSKRPGYTLLGEHTYQIAAYCMGASKLLNAVVEPGGLILPRTYLKRGVFARDQPPGVFFEFPWNSSHIPALMEGIRNAVAWIRNGFIHANPGEYCNWCDIGGFDKCVPLLTELGVMNHG